MTLAFDTPTILLFLSAVWAVAQFFHAFSLRPLIGRGWLTLAVLTLIVIGAGRYAFPRQVGYVSGAMALGLGLAPQWGAHVLNGLITQNKYDRAWGLARILACLHPADGFPTNVRVMAALRSANAGDFAPAEDLLEELKNLNTPIALQGSYLLFRALGCYEDLAEWAHEKMIGKPLRQLPTVALFQIRVLGETGRLNEAFALYRRLRQELPQRLFEILRYRGGDLFLAAFAGRVEHTQKLLEHIAKSGTTIHAFWLATARMANGQPVQEELCRLLAGEPSAIMRRAIEHRLAQAQGGQTPVLASDDETLLRDMEQELDQSRRYSTMSSQKIKPFATYALAGAISFMFILELANGGAMNIKTLWRLGAMNVEAVRAGEWWRLLAYVFLHLGWPHLLLNLAALLLFGPFLERSLGRFRYLLCYLAAGVGAGLVIVILAQLGWAASYVILVGASGAIMGILGATGAVLLRGWRKEAAAVARKRLFGIVYIIVFQIILDQMLPQVSSLVHVLGFGIGFFTALILQMMTRNTPATQGES